MSNEWRLSDSENLQFFELKIGLTRYFAHRIRRVDAEEMALDTLIAAAAHFEHRSTLKHFVYVIARRRVADHWRAQGRRRGRGELVLMCELEGGDIEQLPEFAPSPESVLNIPTRQELLDRALDELPEWYRDVVALWLKGYDNVEIAAVLGINYNTVRSRLSRGKALFLDAFNEEVDGA